VWLPLDCAAIQNHGKNMNVWPVQLIWCKMKCVDNMKSAPSHLHYCLLLGAIVAEAKTSDGSYHTL
jgi:hypothetical protein